MNNINIKSRLLSYKSSLQASINSIAPIDNRHNYETQSNVKAGQEEYIQIKAMVKLTTVKCLVEMSVKKPGKIKLFTQQV